MSPPTNPDAIKQIHAHPHLGLLDYQARQMAFLMDLGGDHLQATSWPSRRGFTRPWSRTTPTWSKSTRWRSCARRRRTARRSRSYSCSMPRSRSTTRRCPRHPDLELMRDVAEEDPVDVLAREQGISFIRLEGTIGCMVNGAGLAMATMDLINRAGGQPANFLDIGGGAKHDKVAAAMNLILADDRRQGDPASTSSAASRAAMKWLTASSRRGASSIATCRWWYASWARTLKRRRASWPRPAIRTSRRRQTLDEAVARVVEVAGTRRWPHEHPRRRRYATPRPGHNRP